ncbi:DUF397 domain-containing protein [Actinomadura harenae]|uniref:DUF397 domain-containing protein n=1 Tax=Actinomadura harenae TaxID=2483351 RepID=A0A3M2MAU9_9ACTN|nr:DUF397 domain-containing protein [Actinomadura harenae]RMI46611.1 DUF397 domain-containing protein [Actinomadura harenae]
MDVTELEWRKSTRSHADGDQCVEVAAAGAGVLIRDSKAPHVGHLLVDRAVFGSAVGWIKQLGQA